MVEYTIETLVHLYDSLNSQIEIVQNNLSKFNYIGIDPNLTSDAKIDVIDTYTKVEKRLEKLISMRDNVEDLLDNILKAEVNK